MDLFQSYCFHAAHLHNIETRHGSNPSDELVAKEIREIAAFFFDQMEWRFNHECPRITA